MKLPRCVIVCFSERGTFTVKCDTLITAFYTSATVITEQYNLSIKV